MFTAAPRIFKLSLRFTSVLVLSIFISTGMIPPQIAFALGMDLLMPPGAVQRTSPLEKTVMLPMRDQEIATYDGQLKQKMINGQQFFLTGASNYYPAEGYNSSYHLGMKLTPGISVASLDFPMGTVLEIYDPKTGKLDSTVVVQDRGPFGVERRMMAVDDEKTGKTVLKMMTVPKRDIYGKLMRHDRRGLDIQVASADEMRHEGEFPVLLKVVWSPSVKMNKQALPAVMLDGHGRVKMPLGGVRVLDIRQKRVVCQDEQGRFIIIDGVKDVAVAVGDRLVSPNQVIGKVTSRTMGVLQVNGWPHPIAEILTPVKAFTYSGVAVSESKGEIVEFDFTLAFRRRFWTLDPEGI